MKKQPVQNETDKQIYNWLTTSTRWQTNVNVKIKRTVHPRTGHESPEVEYRYSSTLSPNSGLGGVGGQQHTPAALTRGNQTWTHETGWAPGAVWMGAKNLVYTAIRSPDRPARSESLYRLRYRGPQIMRVPGEKKPRDAEVSRSRHVCY
jgi:hypothetical protein